MKEWTEWAWAEVKHGTWVHAPWPEHPFGQYAVTTARNTKTNSIETRDILKVRGFVSWDVGIQSCVELLVHLLNNCLVTTTYTSCLVPATDCTWCTTVHVAKMRNPYPTPNQGTPGSRLSFFPASPFLQFGISLLEIAYCFSLLVSNISSFLSFIVRTHGIFHSLDSYFRFHFIARDYSDFNNSELFLHASHFHQDAWIIWSSKYHFLRRITTEV